MTRVSHASVLYPYIIRNHQTKGFWVVSFQNQTPHLIRCFFHIKDPLFLRLLETNLTNLHLFPGICCLHHTYQPLTWLVIRCFVQDFQVPVQPLGWQVSRVCCKCSHIVSSTTASASHNTLVEPHTRHAGVSCVGRCCLVELPAPTGSCRHLRRRHPSVPNPIRIPKLFSVSLWLLSRIFDFSIC